MLVDRPAPARRLEETAMRGEWPLTLLAVALIVYAVVSTVLHLGL